jgi:hypothetical protein
MKILSQKLRSKSIDFLMIKKCWQRIGCLAKEEIFCKQRYIMPEVNTLLKGGLI